VESTLHDRFVWDLETLDANDLDRFGGKGVGLARMVTAGIPVPPGFVIGTDAFRAFHASGAALPATLEAEVDEAIGRLERRTGKRFGEADAGSQAEPLLVAVRSGAPVSMPGMMDTVLNLGLDAAGAFAFGRAMGMAFALDTWLRFWRMFAEIVLLADPSDFERDVETLRATCLAAPSIDAFRLLEDGIASSLNRAGVEVATSPALQLRLAIAAVFQ
jgi:pyruvate,orthophosphate dikinase